MHRAASHLRSGDMKGNKWVLSVELLLPPPEIIDGLAGIMTRSGSIVQSAGQTAGAPEGNDVEGTGVADKIAKSCEVVKGSRLGGVAAVIGCASLLAAGCGFNEGWEAQSAAEQLDDDHARRRAAISMLQARP